MLGLARIAVAVPGGRVPLRPEQRSEPEPLAAEGRRCPLLDLGRRRDAWAPVPLSPGRVVAIPPIRHPYGYLRSHARTLNASRAVTPHIARCVLPPTTVLRATAHKLKRTRFLVAYGVPPFTHQRLSHRQPPAGHRPVVSGADFQTPVTANHVPPGRIPFPTNLLLLERTGAQQTTDAEMLAASVSRY